MAIRPLDSYPGQTDAGDLAGYPQGKAQNQSVAGDGTGTPLEASWLNDLWGFQQALLAAAGTTPSGVPDKVGASDYLTALQALIGSAASPLNDRLAAIEEALATEGEFTVVVPLRATPIVAQGSWSRRTIADSLEGSSQALLHIDITPYVPRGATVTKVEAFVNTSAQDGANRMNVAYSTQAFAALVLPADPKLPRTTKITDAYAVSSAGDQTIVLNTNVTRNESGHYLTFKASAVVAPGVDTLKAVRLTYTRSGL